MYRCCRYGEEQGKGCMIWLYIKVIGELKTNFMCAVGSCRFVDRGWVHNGVTWNWLHVCLHIRAIGRLKFKLIYVCHGDFRGCGVGDMGIGGLVVLVFCVCVHIYLAYNGVRG